MAEYNITCNDGKFNADFHGSIVDMLSLGCCIVTGIYRHIQRHDEADGFAAKTFRMMCETGVLFDNDSIEAEDEQYEEKPLTEAGEDVQ